MTGRWAALCRPGSESLRIFVSLAVICETRFFLSQFSSVCHLLPSKTVQDNCQVDGLVLPLVVELRSSSASGVD